MTVIPITAALGEGWRRVRQSEGALLPMEFEPDWTALDPSQEFFFFLRKAVGAVVRERGKVVPNAGRKGNGGRRERARKAR